MADDGQARSRRPALPRGERERLVLDRAAELFYARGIRAVGMDELIADLGLAKMTVYRLFPTKDALVDAYLRRLERQILAAIDADVARHVDGPGGGSAGALLAVLDAVEADLARPGFRGCPFGNAAVDYDDPAHPARTIAREYREELRRRLRELSERLSGDTVLGDRVAVLVDGAYLSAAHLGADGPARAGIDLARELVAQAGGRRAPRRR